MIRHFDVFCAACHKYIYSISYSSDSTISMMDAVEDAYGRRHYCDECRPDADRDTEEWDEDGA